LPDAAKALASKFLVTNIRWPNENVWEEKQQATTFYNI
jgi:hypothetical protein